MKKNLQICLSILSLIAAVVLIAAAALYFNGHLNRAVEKERAAGAAKFDAVFIAEMKEAGFSQQEAKIMPAVHDMYDCYNETIRHPERCVDRAVYDAEATQATVDEKHAIEEVIREGAQKTVLTDGNQTVGQLLNVGK